MTSEFAPGELVRARGREWVTLPYPQEGVLVLRPLSRSENDVVILAPSLELLPVEPARFDLPVNAGITVQAKALRLAVPRLLIADDVGIGKTIEAGLILRELMDRGEVDAFSVICPPHLVEQWVEELQVRFGINATPVTSGTASRLERGLPIAQTLFEAYPFTVVSLDYIKAEKRREGFARACPNFVIVDEARTCG